ncbi:hypothetical protein B0J18DRAFT_432508 [Chaetomium sp. MPI-SDFR-AT-0129]|nr:hypothetical protein B0J18DRAFT_432508 [Chaetomium sp. MPI-SDFR-AT-0129]
MFDALTHVATSVSLFFFFSPLAHCTIIPRSVAHPAGPWQLGHSGHDQGDGILPCWEPGGASQVRNPPIELAKETNAQQCRSSVMVAARSVEDAPSCPL